MARAELGSDGLRAGRHETVSAASFEGAGRILSQVSRLPVRAARARDRSVPASTCTTPAGKTMLAWLLGVFSELAQHHSGTFRAGLARVGAEYGSAWRGGETSATERPFAKRRPAYVRTIMR